MKKDKIKKHETPCVVTLSERQSYRRNLSLLPRTVVINQELLPKFSKTDLLIYNPIVKKILGENVYKLSEIKENNRLLKYSCGFTLAETLIVLAVLGIVAAITIPPVVKRHMEAVGRTKIKKSMSVYDLAISKMLLENDLKSLAELKNWANTENCPESTKYFKKTEIFENNACLFKTADGVYWDITDITAPKVALKREYLDDPENSLTFTFQTDFDNAGAPRVNDLTWAKLQGTSEELEKLYNYIMNKKESAEPETTADITYNPVQEKINNVFKDMNSLPKCDEIYNEWGEYKSCKYVADDGSYTSSYIFDDSGKNVYSHSSNSGDYLAYHWQGYNGEEYSLYGCENGNDCNSCENPPSENFCTDIGFTQKIQIDMWESVYCKEGQTYSPYPVNKCQ